MNLFKKIIVLVPADYDGIKSEKGILNLDCYPNYMKGQLTCYNLSGKKNLFMGVMVNGQIYKFDLKDRELNGFTFDIPAKVDSSSKVSCAIVELSLNNHNAVLWGSTETSSSWQGMIKNLFEQELEEEETPKNVKVETDLEEEDASLERYIDKVVKATEPKCQFAYAANEEETEQEQNNPNTAFFNKVQKQVENLLKSNESEQVLQEIIPTGRFCKVNFEDDSGYYVFGVIYDEGEPKYLCYGIPSSFQEKPPKDMDGLYQWLPTDTEHTDGNGYWLMYQSAENGKNISVEII